MSTSISEKIGLMAETLAEGDFATLLTLSDEVLRFDPNNSELLAYRFKALCGLNRQFDDIGFLRKYCWYRSSSAAAFWVLAQAYRQLRETDNMLVALAYCLSVERDFVLAKSLLEATLIELGYDELKIAFLTVNRLGHLSMEPDSWFRKKQIEPDSNRVYYLFVCGEVISNSYVFNLLSNKIRIVVNNFWSRIFNSRGLLLNDTFFELMPFNLMAKSRGIIHGLHTYKEFNKIFENTNSIFKVDDLTSEMEFSALKLKNMWSKKIVCIHVRDADYLNIVIDKCTRYHDHRNGTLKLYEPTINYLLSQGYTVVRLGKYSKQHLDIDDPKYIDLNSLPDGKDRDLLDVALLRHCQFLIAMPCGVSDLAASIGTPILVANAIPFAPYYHGKARILPKRLIRTCNQNEVNFMDIFSGQVRTKDKLLVHECLDGNKLLESNLKIEECSGEEILEATIEFIKVCENKTFSEASELQSQYIQDLPDELWFKHSKCWVSDSFLKKNRDLFTHNKILENDL